MFLKTVQKTRLKPKRAYRYLWTFLIAFFSAAFLVNLIVPDSSFSQSENRTLQSFPSFQSSALVDGQWQRDLEKYASDQIVGRSLFFHLNYLFRKALNEKEIDGVYLGKGALLGASSEIAGETPRQNLDTILSFARESSLPCHLLIAPNAGAIQSDKLPFLAPAFVENQVIDTLYKEASEIRTIDVKNLFEQNKEKYLYYRTDHHWTSLGAGLAMSLLLEPMGFTLDNYEKMPVSNTFEGTLANRTGSLFLKDSIDIYIANNNPEYVVTWADGSKTGSIYDLEALYQKDQYQLFLGLNQSVVQIDMLNGSDRNLLLFKDSYANSTIQFLLPFFRSITVVDPRYYYEDLDFLLMNNQITDVVFLFNYNTFVSDSSLQDVLNTYKQGLGTKEEKDTENNKGEKNDA